MKDISDDTVDQIIAGLDENDPTKNTTPEVSNAPIDSATSLLEAQKKEMENTIKTRSQVFPYMR
jgi:hypothetical protein